jgi:hypothetical protein
MLLCKLEVLQSAGTEHVTTLVEYVGTTAVVCIDC